MMIMLMAQIEVARRTNALIMVTRRTTAWNGLMETEMLMILFMTKSSMKVKTTVVMTMTMMIVTMTLPVMMVAVEVRTDDKALETMNVLQAIALSLAALW